MSPRDTRPRVPTRHITPRGDTILSFRTEKGSLAWGTPQGPSLLTFLSTSAPVTSSAFASNRLWDGWLECISRIWYLRQVLSEPSGSDLNGIRPSSGRNRPAYVDSIRWKKFRVFQAMAIATKIRLVTWPRMPISPSTVNHIHPKFTVPSSETPVRFASFSILVTGTNCNGYEGF